MRSRIAVAALVAGLGLLAAVLVSCGGGSSSTTGPSAGGGGGGGTSGAVVRGQIRTGSTARGESTVQVVFERALGIGVAEAAVEGLTVTLTPVPGSTGVQVSATTDASGSFQFGAVLPGEYTISVTDAQGNAIPIDPAVANIVVGAGDLATVTGTVQDGVVVGTVTVIALTTNANDLLQNDAQVGHLVNLALAAGVPADQVLQMRLSGMGWGAIAHALGVHPRNIGLGNEHSAEAQAFQASHGKGKGKGKGKGNV
jgi:hypothetical protein